MNVFDSCTVLVGLLAELHANPVYFCAAVTSDSCTQLNHQQ